VHYSYSDLIYLTGAYICGNPVPFIIDIDNVDMNNPGDFMQPVYADQKQTCTAMGATKIKWQYSADGITNWSDNLPYMV